MRITVKTITKEQTIPVRRGGALEAAMARYSQALKDWAIVVLRILNQISGGKTRQSYLVGGRDDCN